MSNKMDRPFNLDDIKKDYIQSIQIKNYKAKGV